MAGDMGMAPAAPEAEAPAADYTITLTVSGGAITVASSAAAPEGEAEEGAEPSSMPAASIKEAVSMVMDIYAADGDMPAADTSDADFQSGFGKKKAAPVDRVRDMEDMG